MAENYTILAETQDPIACCGNGKAVRPPKLALKNGTTSPRGGKPAFGTDSLVALLD